MVLWFLAAFAAYLMKGLCGFANTLIFTSILSFGTPNANISPIDLLMGYPANVILTWKNRKRLEPRVYLPLIGLVLAGSIPGTLLLKNAEVGTIKLIFGGVVIILGAEMLLLLPVAFAGLLAGMKCSSIVNEKLVRRLTAGLLMLSGVVLILKTI